MAKKKERSVLEDLEKEKGASRTKAAQLLDKQEGENAAGRRTGPRCSLCRRRMLLKRTRVQEDGRRVLYYECDGLNPSYPAYMRVRCNDKRLGRGKGRKVVVEEAEK